MPRPSSSLQLNRILTICLAMAAIMTAASIMTAYFHGLDSSLVAVIILAVANMAALLVLARTAGRLAVKALDVEVSPGLSPGENEERMRFAMEAVGIGEWELNLVDFSAYRSEQHARIFGYPDNKGEWSLPMFLGHVVDEDREWVTATVKGSVAAGRDFNFECRIIRADGRPTWIKVAAMHIAGHQSADRRVVGIVEDIGNRKAAEMKVKASEERFRALYFTMTEGVALHTMIYDEEGQAVDYSIDSVNPAYCLHTGFREEQVTGRRISSFYEEGSLPYIELYESVVKTGLPERFECLFGPLQRNMLVSVFSYFPGKFATVFEDITERKLAEAALRESEQRFRSLVEFSPVGMYFYQLNAEGDLILIGANPAADTVIGIHHADLLGKKIEDCFPSLAESQWPDIYRSIARGEEGPTSFQIEYQDDRFSGFYDVDAFQFGDNQVSVNFVDSSRRRQAEREMQKALEALRISEERYRAVADYTYGWESWVDPYGRLIWVNPSVLTVTGYTVEECLAMPDYPLPIVHPEDRDLITQYFEEASSGSSNMDLEFRLCRKDGSTRWGSVSWQPIYGLNGEWLGHRSSVRDITDRQNSRTEREELLEALRRSEERLRFALEGADEGLWDVNMTNEEFFLNDLACKIMGYGPGDRDNGAGVWRDLINPEDIEVTLESLRCYLKGHAPLLEVRHRLKMKDGSWKWVLTRGQVVERNEQGKPLRMTGTFKDITGQIATEEELNHYRQGLEELVDRRTRALAEATHQLEVAKDDAERANAAKSQFLANMSHEIRTPLNAVIGFSDLLLASATEPRLKSHLDAINAAGKSLLLLINDILDLSKIEAGMMQMQYSVVNVRQVISEVEQIFRETAAQKRLFLEMAIDDSMPGAAVLDEARLRQVLVNLVGNAVKFTEKGGVSIRAGCRPGSTEDAEHIDIYFLIEDTGVGISPEALEHIFDPFYQQQTPENRLYEGTGLGLAISQRLAAFMNGEIHVASVPGAGSAFSLVLHDVEPAPVDYIPPEWDSHAWTELSFEPATVLAVDDIPSNRELLKEILSQMGFRVLIAGNGQEALNTARRELPDLIIMDIRMPVMDGITAVRHLKSHDETRGIPVIALSASPYYDSAGKAEESTFDGYLAKPVRILELLELMARFLPLKEAGDEGATARDRAESKTRSHAITEDVQDWAAPDMKGPGRSANRKPRVLVVDDNDMNLMLASGILEMLGYEPCLCSSGRDCIDTLGIVECDAVFMDCQMPVLNGMETTRLIRANEGLMGRAGHIPIIAMTAHLDSDIHQKCIEAGMDDVITKPVDMNQLRDVLFKWTGYYHRASDKRGTEPRSAENGGNCSDLGSDDLDENRLAHTITLFTATELNAFVDRVLVQVEQGLEEIGRLLDTGDGAGIQSTAHRIKNPCTNIGAAGLARVLAQMEERGAKGDLESIPDLLSAAREKAHMFPLTYERYMQRTASGRAGMASGRPVPPDKGPGQMALNEPKGT